MGIRFECVHCGHTLHVKDFLAGKRGICPHCQGRIEIPATSTASAPADAGIAVEMSVGEDSTKEIEFPGNPQPIAAGPAVPRSGHSSPLPSAVTLERKSPDAGDAPGDPIAEAPQLHWYVLPAGTVTKYGPANGEMMRSWINEGRVAPESFVWREGWPQWRPAASVFPQIVRGAPAAAGPALSSGSVAAAPATTPNPLRPAPAADTSAVVLGIEETLSPATANRAVARHGVARQNQTRRTLFITLSVALCVVVAIFVYVLLSQFQ